MCGFIGRINGTRDGSQEVPRLAAALSILGRRGPDSHRQWRSNDGAVELLHTRLAIVDTDSRAHQPFTDVLGQVTVAFNGEIYNYRELRAELSQYDFRTISDTEVIIALYVTYGLEGLKKLRGMFGLVIVDENKRRVVLARDPVGKKPLYLARWSGNSYFGSSVLALVAASGHDVMVREKARIQFWQDAHVSAELSALNDCRPLLPGQVLELDWSGEVTKISSCTPAIQNEKTLNAVEASARIAELLRNSVSRRLSNNPNPVALLSGGVDSTVVTSFMHSIAGGAAITLGSVVRGTNDERYARYAAKRLGIRLHTVRPRLSTLADEARWALDLQDEPLGMISFFPLALMLRASKDYGKILLTGDGGDEVFLGYGKPSDWLSDNHNNGNHAGAPIPPPAWMSEWGKLTVTDSLIGHMFAKLDRASAEQGMEARCPLLDWELISYVRSLSPEIMFFDGRPKALLKAQLAGWSTEFVNRPKMGFTYNLRWSWATTRFLGLREMVSREALETFDELLPDTLKGGSDRWTTLAIFRNFPMVWKLMAWSRFIERLRSARKLSQSAEETISIQTAQTLV